MNHSTLRSVRAVAILFIVVAILGTVYCLFELNRIQRIYEDTLDESELAGAMVTPVFLARKNTLQMWLTFWIVLGVITVVVDGIVYRYGKQLKKAALAPKCPYCLGGLPDDAQPAACQHCGRALAWFQDRPFSPEEARQRANYEQQRAQREYVQAERVQRVQQEVAAQKAQERAEQQRRRQESSAARHQEFAAKWQAAWNSWKSLIGTDSDGMALTFWVVGILFLGTIVTLVVLILS